MTKSCIAIVELEGDKIRIRLPDTADGYDIGKRLAEKMSPQGGVAILHRTKGRQEARRRT